MDNANISPEMSAVEEDWRAHTRNLLPGIDPADLRPGQKVTISPNLLTGDRSYATQVHEVVAVNTSHVQTRFPHVVNTQPKRLAVLLAHEYHFYAADGFEAE